MAEYIIQDSTLTDIADAIRAKDGSSAPILTEDMADAIAAIPSGTTITNGIVIKDISSAGYITSVEWYGSLIPQHCFGASRYDQGYAYNNLSSIEFKTNNIYLRMMCFLGSGLTELDTDKIVGIDPALNAASKFNNNNFTPSNFRAMQKLTKLSLPNFVGDLNHYEVADCTRLKTVYLPKVQRLASYGASARGCFRNDSALENVQIGSVGYPVTSVDTYPFYNCTQSGLTITLFTTGSYADTAVANTRNGATNATIIIKASEATEYNGTSYAAGETILTSEVTS